MHYYQHHIGDFIKDTNFLTNEEVGIYLKLIWLYYDTEQPLENDIFTLSMKTNARDNQDAVNGILEMYFDLIDNKWHHSRCDKEIAEYAEFCAKQKANGLKGGRPKATQAKPKENPTVSQVDAKESLTTNHKPLTNNQCVETVAKATKAKRLDISAIPKDWEDFCKTNRPDLQPQAVFDQFRDYWIAQGGQKGAKLDWTATWRNWVRNQRHQSIKTQDKPTVAWHQTLGGVMAKGKELGIQPNPGETEGQYRERLMRAGA